MSNLGLMVFPVSLRQYIIIDRFLLPVRAIYRLPLPRFREYCSARFLLVGQFFFRKLLVFFRIWHESSW